MYTKIYFALPGVAKAASRQGLENQATWHHQGVLFQEPVTIQSHR
jgi:hypothetical protein